MVSIALFTMLLAFQESEAVVQEKFTVTYVTLDVTAFRKNGDIVKDLKATDFEVREDRNKVAITSFEVLDFTRATPAPLDPKALPTKETPSLAAIRSEAPLQTRPRAIFVLDLESAEYPDIHKTFSQLENFLKSLALDRETDMLLYSMENGLLTPNFIRDPNTILEVLLGYKDRYLGRLKGRTIVSGSYQLGEDRRNVSKLVRSMEELERKLDQCAKMHAATARDKVDNRAELEFCIREELQAFLDIQELRVERAIGELEALTYRFQDFDGLKTLYFISPGFSLTPGAAAVELARYYLNFSDSDADDVELMENMASPNSSINFISVPSFHKEFQRVAHACIRNRVIFHTFDIYNFDAAANRDRSVAFSDRRPPRVVAHAYRDFAAELNDGLIRLAEESGGEFHSNSTLNDPLGKMLQEPQFFYVLGYQSPEGKSGEFRKIKVKVKRRGVKLRYRGGYFGR